MPASNVISAYIFSVLIVPSGNARAVLFAVLPLACAAVCDFPVFVIVGFCALPVWHIVYKHALENSCTYRFTVFVFERFCKLSAFKLAVFPRVFKFRITQGVFAECAGAFGVGLASFGISCIIK